MTSEGSSLSSNVSSIFSVDCKTAEVDVKGLKIIVLSSSSVTSGSPEILKDPVCSPALINICAPFWIFLTRWLLRSEAYILPNLSILKSIIELNWSSLLPDPLPPTITFLLSSFFGSTIEIEFWYFSETMILPLKSTWTAWGELKYHNLSYSTEPEFHFTTLWLFLSATYTAPLLSTNIPWG